MKIEDIEAEVLKADLKWKQCNSKHWQVRGGIAMVNVYRRKDGFSIHTAGMGKGRKVSTPSEVVDAATTFRPAQKTAVRICYRRMKNRKWDRIVNRGGKPRCHWCQSLFQCRADATADHVVPVSKGGSNGDDNIVLACGKCNTKRKNNVTAEEIASVHQHRCDADAWPPRDVVAKLVDAATILLDDHDYDGHGYEEIAECRKRAVKFLSQQGAPFDQK